MQSLTISLVQSDLYWEDPQSNLQHFTEVLKSIPQESHIVILPEMFSTGFSMQPDGMAETMDGATLHWMKAMARQYKKIITGSVMIEEGGRYFNRLVWMQPDGKYFHYDKRHLFAYASEDKHYTAGDKRLIVRVNGWKICLQVCYDLRFPVWARQRKTKNENTADSYYDILLYVANWPERRSLAWKILLQARAIENQCYTIGVNRVGHDGNGIKHSGDSSVIDPLGNIVWQQANLATTFTYTLQKEALTEIRQQFPFLNDADEFLLV